MSELIRAVELARGQLTPEELCIWDGANKAFAALSDALGQRYPRDIPGGEIKEMHRIVNEQFPEYGEIRKKFIKARDDAFKALASKVEDSHQSETTDPA
jgi:hypothetical protein